MKKAPTQVGNSVCHIKFAKSKCKFKKAQAGGVNMIIFQSENERSELYKRRTGIILMYKYSSSFIFIYITILINLERHSGVKRDK